MTNESEVSSQVEDEVALGGFGGEMIICVILRAYSLLITDYRVEFNLRIVNLGRGSSVLGGHYQS